MILQFPYRFQKGNTINKGRKLSEEMKKKLSLAHIGKTSGMLGKHHSEKTRMKLSKANVGKRLSKETKRKISLFLKGNQRGLGGKGSNGKLKGRKISEDIRRKFSIAQTLRWSKIEKKTNKRYIHIRDKKYISWRSQVFQRDNWTCQTCGARGIYLEAHHIKSWALFPEFRFELDNGVALCLSCHKLTKNYKGRKYV